MQSLSGQDQSNIDSVIQEVIEKIQVGTAEISHKLSVAAREMRLDTLKADSLDIYNVASPDALWTAIAASAFAPVRADEIIRAIDADLDRVFSILTEIRRNLSIEPLETLLRNANAVDDGPDYVAAVEEFTSLYEQYERLSTTD